MGPQHNAASFGGAGMILRHLSRLTTDHGVFEHCLGGEPRVEHGYCVDDAARALVVLLRSQLEDPLAARLMDVYFRFLGDAQVPDGRVINRRAVDGSWHGSPSTDDHWGRAIWAWGTAVHRSRDVATVASAYDSFCRSAKWSSLNLRSMVFASLGAAEVLEVFPGNAAAQHLLIRTMKMLEASENAMRQWPEPRLTYANAAIPEAMMLIGDCLNVPELAKRGRSSLEWLWELQHIAGRLSVVPHGGWVPGDSLPAFDQQPIEVAALVDACLTAYDLTSDPAWMERAIVGRRWYEGHNDQGILMYDPESGGGFDALTPTGRNENMGAESTIAYLSVEQRTSALPAMV